MIQSNVTVKAFPSFRMLTDDQIDVLINAAMEILEKVGYKILHADARKMLKSAGAIVDGEMVKLPQFIVRQCLATAPKGWTIYDREGNRALDVEGRQIKAAGEGVAEQEVAYVIDDVRIDLLANLVSQPAQQRVDAVFAGYPVGRKEGVPQW